MEFERQLGISQDGKSTSSNGRLTQYIFIKLAANGYSILDEDKNNNLLDIAHDLIANHREKNRILREHLCPVDMRIQSFIDLYFSKFIQKYKLKLPGQTFILDRHGIARKLSLPLNQDEYISDYIKSYRLKQGILHNPRNDRRTTKGVFHVCAEGLPVPYDKKETPLETAAFLLEKALAPSENLLELPFTATKENKAKFFVSLLLRPKVFPEVENIYKEKSMEIRFFAPGSLVSNLDFVESIFGNAGDPNLPQNNSALDVDHWTGHTGCVILAPQLVSFTKKEAGLPYFTNATERQKKDGMCWQNEDELYNDGMPFKICIRNEMGVIITLIADNYFGYSKKEVKSQISYSANLFGNCEEEHAGGAIAFASFNLGEEFHVDSQIPNDKHKFSEINDYLGHSAELQPDGYAIDTNYQDIIYLPDDAAILMNEQKIKWKKKGKEKELRLAPANTYILPCGYKIKMNKNPKTPAWRLEGTSAEGTFCHKPSTVSGGGKSEISKSISDSIFYRPFFVANFKDDFKKVKEIINKDYSNRFIDYKNYKKVKPSRIILSHERSLGSVIKLLTPSATHYTEEYNKWLKSIPQYIKGLVFIVKRFYKPEWGNDWQKHFSVDIVDGSPGHELKYMNRKIVATYLRVGLEENGAWRNYKLRQDFMAAEKIQVEDDITCSTVVPVSMLEFLNMEYDNPCVKFVDNCEYRFFQRPDEAIHRGYDKQAESDLSTPNTFISNYEPLTLDDAQDLMNDSINFDTYTKPVRKLIEDFVKNPECKYFVSSAHPRVINGTESKNMRYLQNRTDLANPRAKYIAEVGVRLARKIPYDKPVYFPVNAVLPGRRNNPPEKDIRALSVYNPIHYQELPELFMEFISSLTGKSPSTTGAGSEGALTKAPFNSLSAVTDLNNALVSFILTGYNGFSTPAGYIGEKIRIEHDISLLMPEIWCRLSAKERNPEFLIKEGSLEKLNDFEHNGKLIKASRLGYRITSRFVHTYFGRVFENPRAVFIDEILKPEIQNMDVFADGINNIVEAQERIAKYYFLDGSINGACPPLKALLHIMAYGHYEGKKLEDAEIRNMFNRDVMLESEWYEERLMAKQLSDIALWQKHVKSLQEFISKPYYTDEIERLNLIERLSEAKKHLEMLEKPSYFKQLKGTIGKDKLFK